jgi:hypothetical protein
VFAGAADVSFFLFLGEEFFAVFAGAAGMSFFVFGRGILYGRKARVRRPFKRQKDRIEKKTAHRQYGVKGLRPLAGRGAAPHKKEVTKEQKRKKKNVTPRFNKTR